MSLRVLMCQESVDLVGPTSSMSPHRVLSRLVKRILPCLFAAALLGAACSSDSPTLADATPADATLADTGPDSGSGDSTAAETAGDDEAVAIATADDTGAGDAPSMIDWPLVYDGATVDGSEFDAGDYEGQDLVLWFWAPW